MTSIMDCGTKSDTLPPIAATCLTNVEDIARVSALAGTKTVLRSGARVAFIPAICIS